MAETTTDYVEGLNGTEVINDLLDQVAQRLHSDCNLRDSDSYTGGYKAHVTVKLTLYGLDPVDVEKTVIVSKPTAEAVAPENAERMHTVESETEVEVPVEERLNVVRERSGQDIPTLTRTEEGKPEIKRRSYAKPDTKIVRGHGGAMGDKL